MYDDRLGPQLADCYVELACFTGPLFVAMRDKSFPLLYIGAFFIPGAQNRLLYDRKVPEGVISGWVER